MKNSRRILPGVIGLSLGMWAFEAHGSVAPPVILQIAADALTGESGYLGPQNLSSYPLTSTPYDFAGQLVPIGGLVPYYPHIGSIDSITVTLTIVDGDSALGDFDFGNLTLGLDGIDTGFSLSGFSNSNIATFTLTKLNPSLNSALIDALADNQWVGSVIDSTPGNAPAGDTIGFPSRIDTSLDLVVSFPRVLPGVPLPPAVIVAPLGVVAAGAWSWRWRRAK
jgi:hypothetical protein